MDRIEINKDLIPYTFEILLCGELFEIRVDYNSTGDLFVLSLYKDGQLIRAGQPLIYGMKLWETVYVSGGISYDRYYPVGRKRRSKFRDLR